MANSVTPYVKRTSFSEAIQKALPIIAQREAQNRALDAQQARLDQQQAQFRETMQLRQDQESNRNAKMIYDAQKAQEKADKEARSSLATPDNIGVLNSGEAGVYELANKVFSEDAEQLPAIISQLSLLSPLFNSSHEITAKKREEFENYTWGTEKIGNGLKWTATEKELKAQNKLVENGGFDPNTLEWDAEEGRFVAEYLDYGLDESGNPKKLGLKGPIQDAPFYGANAQVNMYNKATYSEELAEMNPASYFMTLDDYIGNLNSNTDLSKEEKRESFKSFLTTSFSNENTLDDAGRQAYNTMLVNFRDKNYPKNPTQQLTDEEKDKALKEGVDEINSLYNPTISDSDRLLGVSDFYDKKVKGIYNSIVKLNLPVEEASAEFSKRVNSLVLNDISKESESFRNFAKDSWEQENAGLDYDEVAKQSANEDQINALIEFAPPFQEPEVKEPKVSQGRKPTQTQINQAQAASLILESGSQTERVNVSEFDTELFKVAGADVGEVLDNVTVTNFELPNLKVKFDLSNYLTEEYIREEGSTARIQKGDPRIGKETNPKTNRPYQEGDYYDIPGAYKEVKGTPTRISPFIDDSGNKIIMLHGFSDRNVPPVFINVSNAASKNRIDQLLGPPYGSRVTVDEMFRIHGENLLK